MHGVHVLLHFQPDDGSELALAQFGFDHHQQIVGQILVALGDGVAGDAEQLAAFDHHAGKQQVEIVGDHILQRYVQLLVADLEKARDTGADRHLDPRQPIGIVVGITHRHQQIERQVGNEWERVRRVHGLRGDQGKDVLQVVLAHLLALFLGQPLVAAQHDALLLQQPMQLGRQQPLLLHDVAHHRQTLAHLLLGATAVHRQFPYPRTDLLLEATDAFHEKFVQIGTDDGQKLDPLQQRIARVLGFVQHSLVEGQPSQFAVQIPFGSVQIDRGR